jgi:hypothetical protein
MPAKAARRYLFSLCCHKLGKLQEAEMALTGAQQTSFPVSDVVVEFFPPAAQAARSM